MNDKLPIPVAKDTEAEKKARSALDGTLQDVEQYIVDGLLTPDIASHIPGVKYVVAFARAFNAVRDRMLLLKIAQFFEALSDVPLADKRLMAQSLETDPKYRRKVGEHILDLLERIESKRKPAMCGYVFAAYAKGEIDVTLLQRLLSCIERLPSIEIDSVRIMVEAGPGEVWAAVDRETKTALGNAGLLDLNMTMDGNMYDLNPTGRAFVQLGLDTKTAGPESILP
jgi:hypothetical protein